VNGGARCASAPRSNPNGSHSIPNHSHSNPPAPPPPPPVPVQTRVECTKFNTTATRFLNFQFQPRAEQTEIQFDAALRMCGIFQFTVSIAYLGCSRLVYLAAQPQGTTRRATQRIQSLRVSYFRICTSSSPDFGSSGAPITFWRHDVCVSARVISAARDRPHMDMPTSVARCARPSFQCPQHARVAQYHWPPQPTPPCPLPPARIL
jgi:hypothetical protein